MRLYIDEDSGTYRWRLLRRTVSGADVIARAARDYPDKDGCRAAVATLAEAEPVGDAVALSVRCTPDGHWWWMLTAADGTPVAQSPAVFRDPGSCRDKFVECVAEIRRAGLGRPVLAR